MDRRLLLYEIHSASFKIVNKCRRTIWPGLLSGANTPQLPTTGFSLRSGKSKTVSIPKYWSGRIWGRTLCGEDSTGKFSCMTADCGSGKVECAGGGAKPPATLAEFTLNGAGGLDFYDVSLVDGYNLPMLVVPRGGTGGGCSATGCLVDLNGACPSALRVARENGRGTVACRSACEAFADPRFCCSEAYSTPDTCGPSIYSLFFKYACPRAYSYAYDDKTSTYTCASADYMIIFCPSPYTSQKLLGARKDGAQLPLVNKTTMYMASQHASSSGLVQMQFIAAIFLFWLLIQPL
ncbi:thaumatin-like protein 1b isoform X2 [Juglans regia]|uniref:Thaumatin-like protein 1b isoform X2 n=1 Tax=Juglans regia TaxID=51240 RepID=A0A2I4EWY1_JUGRE|nr:thaumatin-like protein 1b isoform X2 [Juglans regia]